MVSYHSGLVYAAYNTDKIAALDTVLEKTGFEGVVRRRASELGVSVAKLRIAIKANFMIMYSLNDRSTYTDTGLVDLLVNRLYGFGCRDIAIVESQNVFGNAFEGRQVKRVAKYVGYRLNNQRYRVVDLTEEMEPFDYGWKLGKHFAGRTWRDADLRISFAKNKTHPNGGYTLCIKNTFGALPMQDKMHEYHEIREIYYATIDALRHFPVHYSLIDASISADGQFGIIADKKPNKTDTIIGGQNIIAVDWVGAEKMGLDPMVSPFMKQAVEAFGMPEIERQGDLSLYPNWRNVEPLLTESWDHLEEWNALVDRVLQMSKMDSYFPRRKSPWYIRLGRRMFDPIIRLLFKNPR